MSENEIASESTQGASSTRKAAAYTTSGLVAIMGMWLLFCQNGSINGCLNAIAQLFPDVPFTTLAYIGQLPSFFVIPAMLITGFIAGKKVRYRTLAIIGLILSAVPNLACIFATDVMFILAMRGVFGIGHGILTALVVPYIIMGYESDEASKKMGVATICQYVGSIVLQLLAGFLAEIYPTYCFGIYGAAFLVLILVIAKLPEPPKSNDPNAGKITLKLPAGVWGIGIMWFFFLILYFAFITYSSVIMDVRGMGGAAMASTILSINTLGGAACGLIVNKYFNGLKRFSLPVAAVINAVFLVIAGYTGSLIVFGICSFMLGAFYGICQPIFALYIGFICKPEQVASANAITTTFLNIAAFLIPTWIGILSAINPDPGFAMVASGICFAIFAIILFIVKGMGLMEGNANYATKKSQ